MPRTALVWIVLAAALMVAAPLHAAGPTATVSGVDTVNVRRGPGPDTPAFTMLRKGARVTVMEMAGTWALIELADGQRGYINAAFLVLPPGANVPTAVGGTAAAAATVADATPQAASAVGTVVAPTDTPATPADTPAAGQIEQRLEQALDRIRALESSRTDPTIAAADHSPAQREHTPLPLGIEPPTPTDEYGDFRDIAASLALAGVGFFVGFLLGVAYGQRQERHRRGRVRF